MQTAEIRARFGDPDGNVTGPNRIAKAARMGYFLSDGKRPATYTAVKPHNVLLEWTPEMRDMLALLWPTLGYASVEIIAPGKHSECRKQAHKMKLRLPPREQSVKPYNRTHVARNTCAKLRNNATLGAVVTRRVSSVFDYAEKLANDVANG